MIRDKYIMEKFKNLTSEAQVQVLLDALDYMAKADYKNKVDCISLAMGIPLFPKIVSIENIEGYTITVRFHNNEERIIDFTKIFSGSKPLHKVLLENYEKFKKVTLIDETLAWPDIGASSQDIEGKDIFDYYDIDPGLLYENSTLVECNEAAKGLQNNK